MSHAGNALDYSAGDTLWAGFRSGSMTNRILVFYGSYRSDRMGIRLADYVVAGLAARGDDVELIDAKAIGLPMLDRMFKEYGPGSAPPAMATLASKIRAADPFLFIPADFNSGIPPALT